MSRAPALTVVATMLLCQACAGTRSQKDLVGTWRLVSAYSIDTAGTRMDAPYGAKPTGLITYTADGRMSSVISYDGRKPLSGDRVSTPASERAEAFATSFGYAGAYDVRGNQVTHHVEVSTVQNWVNTDLVRTVVFEGQRLTLQTPPLSIGGVLRTTHLTF